MRCNLFSSRLRTSLFALAILVPSVAAVNHFTERTRELKADGIPIPPLPPQGSTLVADGIPIPPLPPQETTLVADGIPIPPLPPQETTLVADGIPIPPLPPQNGAISGVSA